MIGYVTLGTNDIERAAAFYDALLAPIGATRFMDFGSFIAWHAPPDGPALALTRPFDGQPATVGNGVMVALAMSSREEVDAMHSRAIALGGTDEGAPGPRAERFYAGYFRDPDGNKLNAFFLG